MPVISDGGAFNGGTITTPLTINANGTPGTLLDIEDTALNTFDIQIIEQNLGGGVVNAKISARGDGTGVAQLDLLDGAGTSEARLSTDTGLLIDSAINASGSTLTSVSSAWWGLLFKVLTQAIQVGAPCYFLSGAPPTLQNHTIPASNSLAAGDCALWFDQTDGAAKLMIKAKQADGTVRTGSVNLA